MTASFIIQAVVVEWDNIIFFVAHDIIVDVSKQF